MLKKIIKRYAAKGYRMKLNKFITTNFVRIIDKKGQYY